MIRTNSFAVLIGDGAEEELRKGAQKVQRHSMGAKIGPGKDFGVESGGGPETAVAVLALNDGFTLPIVHGFFEGDEQHRGEFSLLMRNGEEYVAERDALGTRQLYLRWGKLTGVSTDFRFFDSRPEDLLPPGAMYSVKSGLTRRRDLVPVSTDITLSAASGRLAKLIDDAVRRRAHGFRKVGVAFSGGLDSSVVAHCSARHADVTLFSVYARGSKDETWSRRAAELLDLEHVACPIDAEDVSDELKCLTLPFEPSPMDKVLWCVYSVAGRAARERGLDVLLLGQLADELFGGYMKYALQLQRSGEAAARGMMEGDVRECSSRGFIRDETACAKWVEPRFPFADEGVVRFALGLPIEWKISGRERKVVLRRAAFELGLPETLAASPKKAAQYSSGVMKLIR